MVVAGGDGSIGLAALVAAEMGVPLAVVPVGTANDFARALELPMDLEEACALARDPRATTRHAELALAGERPFVNAAATGLSVIAAARGAPAQVAPRPARLCRRRDQGGGHRDAAEVRGALRRRP